MGAWIPSLGALMLVALVYSPGLNGPYVLDDAEHLLANPAIAVKTFGLRALYDAALSGDPGMLRRPLANLSFGLNYYFAGGFEPSLPFKITNLAVHLVNAVLVYALMLMLARTPALSGRFDRSGTQRFALIAAALWALHPIQVTSVLYVVQRMNSLSASFVLLGLILFVQSRSALTKGEPRALYGMALGIAVGVAGTLAKENAILIVPIALVIEYCLFRTKSIAAAQRRALAYFYIALVALSTLPAAALLIHDPGFLTDPYVQRHFSMLERALTEPRVLWFYLWLIFVPDVTRLGLFHDDIVLSTGLFTPWTTFPAIAALVFAAGGAVMVRRRLPLLSFAVLWFLAGHLLESSVIGLEIAYEHRNYVPSLGPIAAVAAVLARLNDTAQHRKVFRPLTAALLMALAVITWTVSSAWRSAESLAAATLRNHPESPRANDFAASLSLAQGDIAGGLEYMQRALTLAPGEVGFVIDVEILAASLSAEINEQIARDPSTRARLVASYARAVSPHLAVTARPNGITIRQRPEQRQKIAMLLASRPISVHGTVSLENLFQCMTTPPQPCRGILGDATQWFALASENPKAWPIHRALILANSAQLHAQTGDYRQAIRQTQQAIALDGDRVHYRLLLADLLLKTGRHKDAASALGAIPPAHVPPPGEKHHDHYERLRKTITKTTP